MRDAVLGYQDAVAELAGHLLTGLAVGLLGEEHRDYFATRLASEPTRLFRVFRYPVHHFAPEADEWGVREHTDYGILTILKQDDCGGLEVRAGHGQWVQAPPVPGTFVVNLGDMLEMWTGGRYRATPHRVRNAAGRFRYSYPFFFDPSWDAKLDPIEDALMGDAPSRPLPRWDGLALAAAQGSTYGQWVTSKVAQVFPGEAARAGLY